MYSCSRARLSDFDSFLIRIDKDLKAAKRSSQERHRYDSNLHHFLSMKNLKIVKKVQNFFERLKNPVKERKIFIRGKTVWIVASKKRTQEIQELLDRNEMT
jgi:hypothetical protein